MSTETPPGLVAVPAVPWMFTDAAVAFANLAANLPQGSGLTFIRSGTTLAKKRNRAVHRARDASAKWLLQIDSDMTPPPDVAERLWSTLEETGADAVTATITSSSESKSVKAYVMPDNPPPDREILGQALRSSEVEKHRGPMKVEGAGAACLMVRMEVFRTMERPWFRVDGNGIMEDINFSYDFRDAGFEMVLDTEVHVGHLGVHPFGLGDADRADIIRKVRPDQGGS